ncbi:rhodanese-like domain-containing protein [Teredinibacter sp. KSP-S5-2]|uniref:rhodanese-like domain-containing protein n=1 Tax=Teredinibacter sp. KSP-S5-2 TaxID=3034506 RepID=UPI00293413F2|nr:rhodanese-like domain-containing protein [Teredinibacter sp. KSP-S5-2]WNO08485.1 rhodanese-like domain-containing protein [Teredinibacter sp. KSP-S5-2]
MSKTAMQLVQEAKQCIDEVEAETLKQKLGDAPIIIDVREPAEYNAGHIFGAINIPRGLLEFEVEGHPAVEQKIAPSLQLKEAEIYLYCRTGGRSALAAKSLQDMGFQQLKSLAGGYLAWEAAEYPIQSV